MSNSFFANVAAIKYNSPLVGVTQAFTPVVQTIPADSFGILTNMTIGGGGDTITIAKGGYSKIYSAPGEVDLKGGLYLPAGTTITIAAFAGAGTCQYLGVILSNT